MKDALYVALGTIALAVLFIVGTAAMAIPRVLPFVVIALVAFWSARGCHGTH